MRLTLMFKGNEIISLGISPSHIEKLTRRSRHIKLVMNSEHLGANRLFLTVDNYPVAVFEKLYPLAVNLKSNFTPSTFSHLTPD